MLILFLPLVYTACCFSAKAMLASRCSCAESADFRRRGWEEPMRGFCSRAEAVLSSADTQHDPSHLQGQQLVLSMALGPRG